MLQIVHQLDPNHVDDLMVLYAPEFWTHHRRREDVRRMLENSDVTIGVIDTAAAGKLVGFCRVLTDFVYRATLYDVIVAPSHRGRGVGRMLLDAVVNQPQLREVEYIDLSCKPEMTELYHRWGFKAELNGTLFLRRPRLGV